MLGSERSELDNLVNDKRHADARYALGKVTKDFAAAESEEKQATSRMFSMVAPVSRALKKYQKVSNLDSQLLRVLDSYLSDSVRAAASDRGKSLSAILADIVRVSAQLSLDGKEAAKVDELRTSISDGSFASAVEKLDNAISVSAKSKAVLDESLRASRASASELDVARKKMDRVCARISILEKQKNDLEQVTSKAA